jgi:hypothetical protein
MLNGDAHHSEIEGELRYASDRCLIKDTNARNIAQEGCVMGILVSG